MIQPRVKFLEFPETREKTQYQLLTCSFQHCSKETISFAMDIYFFSIYHFATISPEQVFFKFKESDEEFLLTHLSLFY